MAVFFDHKVKSPVQGQFTDIQWHKTAPLLAIACVAEPTKSGIVSLFMEEVSSCLLWIIRSARNTFLRTFLAG